MKAITDVTNENWSETLELLLGLSVDPYGYQELTNNPCSFKIRNKEK
jgi:hypothetical protein